MAAAYELSAGLFVRGLANLKTQLMKAEAHAAVSGIGEAALLNASLATAYGILRNQGVKLTMSDFLGNWAAG
jgi:hypothetical protein